MRLEPVRSLVASCDHVRQLKSTLAKWLSLCLSHANTADWPHLMDACHGFERESLRIGENFGQPPGRPAHLLPQAAGKLSLAAFCSPSRLLACLLARSRASRPGLNCAAPPRYLSLICSAFDATTGILGWLDLFLQKSSKHFAPHCEMLGPVGATLRAPTEAENFQVVSSLGL